MTVKCLTPEEKKSIRMYYTLGSNQTVLAEIFGVSRRTIKRVLEELGELVPYRPREFEQKRILDICEKHNIDSVALEHIIRKHHQAQRIIEKHTHFMDVVGYYSYAS